MSEIELKPCPFCGGEAEWLDTNYGGVAPACRKCSGYYPGGSTEWNARPIEDALRAALTLIENEAEFEAGDLHDEYAALKMEALAKIAHDALHPEEKETK